MSAKRKVAILLYENDPYPHSEGHFIWSLCRIWQEQGIEIVPLKGVGQYVAADLLIPHVDATFLPADYISFFQKYPRVINRRLHDISKRLISRNLLAATDNYDGPVMVKTNLNSGGLPDINFPGRRIRFPKGQENNFWKRLLSRKRRETSRNWAKINCLAMEDYQVFPSLKNVPEAVFANESLVTERFLPEIENGIYYLRLYTFFGDRAYCARVGSPDPVVKQKNIISREEISIPEEVVAFRREFNMDYGKIDFVIHQGRVVVFDVNRTPGIVNPPERMQANALKLADGINSLF